MLYYNQGKEREENTMRKMINEFKNEDRVGKLLMLTEVVMAICVVIVVALTVYLIANHITLDNNDLMRLNVLNSTTVITNTIH